MILFRRGNSALSASAAGGEPRSVTTLDPGEVRHFNPRFLPDGRHFLYMSFPTVNIYLGSLDSTSANFWRETSALLLGTLTDICSSCAKGR